jgi:hypothetical protein
MVDRVRTAARAASRPWTWRTTNLALLGALALAFFTGAAAQATGSARGASVAIVHGVVGLVVVVLVPRKRRVAVVGFGRRRPGGRWFSVGLAGLALGTLAAGLGSSRCGSTSHSLCCSCCRWPGTSSRGRSGRAVPTSAEGP